MFFTHDDVVHAVNEHCMANAVASNGRSTLSVTIMTPQCTKVVLTNRDFRDLCGCMEFSPLSHEYGVAKRRQAEDARRRQAHKSSDLQDLMDQVGVGTKRV